MDRMGMLLYYFLLEIALYLAILSRRVWKHLPRPLPGQARGRARNVLSRIVACVWGWGMGGILADRTICTVRLPASQSPPDSDWPVVRNATVLTESHQ